MRYSTEPKFRKYIKGYGLLSFATKFGHRYGKKLIDRSSKNCLKQSKSKNCRGYRRFDRKQNS